MTSAERSDEPACHIMKSASRLVMSCATPTTEPAERVVLWFGVGAHHQHDAVMSGRPRVVILFGALCAGKTTIATGFRDQRVVVALLWGVARGAELAQVEHEVFDAARPV